MGDRTKIADALERMIRSGHYDPRDVQNLRAAARLLRADPDTSDDSELTVAALAWIKVNSQHVATPLIAALLERAVTAEADLRTLSTRTTGDSKTDLRMLYAYEAGVMEGEAERDAERAARERAETEARQLREAIGDPDELIANAHYGRAANGHGDDLFATVSRIAAAVAEGAEDR